jgi:hypothetical protein
MNNLSRYLDYTEIIDYDNSIIINFIDSLNLSRYKEVDKVRYLFEYVRDEISHSFDINGSIITCKASEVLANKQGICYAKSNLFAALLRAIKIPCGFGYQRIILDDTKYNWLVLHGYNFVHITEKNKWIKFDPRGNNDEVNVQFSLDRDCLAFPIRTIKSESDENVNHPEPKKSVIESLKISKTINELIDNLPNDF